MSTTETDDKKRKRHSTSSSLDSVCTDKKRQNIYCSPDKNSVGELEDIGEPDTPPTQNMAGKKTPTPDQITALITDLVNKTTTTMKH
jgi:hypothetical protein